MKHYALVSKTFVLFFLILVCSTYLFAQDLDDVTISGRVTDANKAVIPGATVTAILVESQQERTVTADDEGRYRLIELKPGTYLIRVSATGFSAQERSNLVTLSGQNLQIDFILAPAGVKTETVVVDQDTSPTVDTTRTIVGGTVTEREIEELPNNTRNPLDLVFTLGGTSEEALSTRDLAEDRNVNSPTAPAEQGNFSLSGGASYSNNITIDGLDNNDDFSANTRFQPSLESIAEVQVITNQFSSEYGRASGGRVNLRTRSGNNQFRGRVFMFFRDDNLNANTWYNNFRSFPRLPLTEYNPGFTFAGPVKIPSIYNGKNRTFFSIAYEYNLIQDTTLIDTWVPVGNNPRYTLPTSNVTCPTNISCLDTNSSPATAIAPYNVLYDTPNVNHVFNGKFDHKLFRNNDLTIGIQIGRTVNRRTRDATTTRIDNALQARKRKTNAFNVTDNHVFGANVVNQFRMQYSTFEPSYETDNPLDPVVLIGYRNPLTNGLQTLIAGNSTAGISGDSTAFPQNRNETRWQFQDSVTYIVGDHTLKFGFDVQTVRSKALGLGDATGTFNFANILNYQQNVLSRYRQNYGTASDVKNTYMGFFIQDETKVISNVTLSYGLRYERETSVSDNNNFGPRAALAWDPFKKGTGVIRFGAGLFYNRVLLRTVADSIQNNIGITPFDTNFIGTGATDNRRVQVLAAIANQFPNTYPSMTALQNLVTQVCAPINTAALPCNSSTGFQLNQGSAGNPLRSVDPDLQIPQSYQFNVGFERELAKGWIFETNYSWNKTNRLWRDRNINAPVLPAGFADWTAYLLANPFVFTVPNATTPTTRTYIFYLGSTTDGFGTSSTQGGTTACPTTGTINCFVNLNSVSTSTVSPSIAVAGSSTNSIGGPIGIALAAISRFRPDQNFEEKSRIGSIGKAFYQGLVFELRSRFRKFGSGFGGTFRGVYTLSSTKDDGLNNTSNAEINGDFERDYTRSYQDRRHRLAVSGTFDTPWWFGKLRFSPLFRYGSSSRFNLGAGGSDRNLDDLGTDRLNFNGNFNDIVWRRPGTPFQAALAAQFSLQPIGAKGGNLPRNAGKGPSFYLFDVSVTREFKFTEKMKLRPTIQFDNVLNSAVFNFGAGFVDYTALSATATPAQRTAFENSFLVPTRTFRPRQIRIGLRFDF
jgi:hypothetical protein